MIYLPDKVEAEQIAESCRNDDEDGWTYTVKGHGTPWWYIEVRNDLGEVEGNL